MNVAMKAFTRLHENGRYHPEDLFVTKEYRALVDATASTISTAIPHSVSDSLKSYLERDVFVFSGLKTHTQLTEARSYLKDEQGNIRPFYAFKQDVLKLNEQYNQNYLEAEYEFAIHSAQTVERWESFSDDTNHYFLEYRTAGDNHVRPEHASLEGICLPKDDPFWQYYMPPNGWRCRCSAIEVIAPIEPVTDPNSAMVAGDKATTKIGKSGKNTLEMFRFNPAIEKRVFPKNNAYSKVVGAETVKQEAQVQSTKVNKEREKTIIYQDTTIEKLKEIYERQTINKKNEKIIMNTDTGYIQTVNSFDINLKLRNDKPLSKSDQRTIKALDSLIEDNTLPNNIVLYRNDGIAFIKSRFGIDEDKIYSLKASELVKAIKATKITEFLEKGYFSTSAIKNNNIFLSRRVQSEIRVKKGTNAFVTNNWKESEVILKRNQRYKIVDISSEKDKIKIIMEIVN
jgi:hypothetical protein|nr:MAG TPA: minor capsid component [Caudoviricetes sp.]